MYFYLTFKERRESEDAGYYTSYGIKAVFASYGIYRDILSVPDVSTVKGDLDALAGLCTRGQLSPIHLKDAVEDFLK